MHNAQVVSYDRWCTLITIVVTFSFVFLEDQRTVWEYFRIPPVSAITLTLLFLVSYRDWTNRDFTLHAHMLQKGNLQTPLAKTTKTWK